MKVFPTQGHTAKGWELQSAGEQLRGPGSWWLLWETNPERRWRLWPHFCSWLADVGCCQLLHSGGRRGEAGWLDSGQGATKSLVCYGRIALPHRTPSLQSAIATRVKTGSGLPVWNLLFWIWGLGLHWKCLFMCWFGRRHAICGSWRRERTLWGCQAAWSATTTWIFLFFFKPTLDLDKTH